ncbi:hypothetical protein PR003_g22531 [Phytophthora rubi]|uniref:RxLR effector protein n=1 Tax=Phytophthora rubi TaxID=129364 RepID=A0A6A3LBA6_9STRA|nr:hypothetical protein PR002_g21659 [Phytophthora rubi]KAE9013103.1 hypothetical protein PR001_g15493 [Phytophthora rubi]KAE9301403.1 hypothetical protein PR003_g22531 [Phytophthora rubi]
MKATSAHLERFLVLCFLNACCTMLSFADGTGRDGSSSARRKSTHATRSAGVNGSLR